MKPYDYIGLNALMSDNEHLEALKKIVSEDSNYSVPGYQYDYKHYSFKNYIEFEYRHTLSGEPCGIDMHFCSNSHWTLELNCILENQDSTHLFEMKIPRTEIVFPVRIICPDVLPNPKQGDLIRGQVVVFADPNSVKTGEDEVQKIETHKDGVYIYGRILDVNHRKFEFNGIVSSFWEIDVGTPIGTTTVLISDSVYEKEPECNIYIPVDGKMVHMAYMILMKSVSFWNWTSILI